MRLGTQEGPEPVVMPVRPVRSSWMLCVLLAAGMAGCAGASDEPAAPKETDAPSETVVEAEPGAFVSENRGILRGRVIDDRGFGVAKAHLSLIGTNFFTKTNNTGHFKLDNVTVGTHTVQVQMQGFHSLTKDVQVNASAVTNVQLRLVPQQVAGAGYRSHTHDFWGERTQITLMDAPVSLSESSNGENGYGGTNGYTRPFYAPNSNTTNIRYAIPDEVDVPPIILPGSKELHVTFRWTSDDSPISRLGLGYADATTSRVTFLGPKSTGDTWVIPVNDTTADSGHQQFTLWAFYIYYPNSYSGVPNWEPAHGLGDVDVEMILVKGDVYIEPPHTDYWGTKSMLVLRPLEEVTRAQTVCCSNRRAEGDSHTLRLDGPTLVPPGTVRMRLDFRFQYEGQSGSTPADLDYHLTWRTGEQDPARTGVVDYKRVDPSLVEPGRKVYEFDVPSFETDAFYQGKSNWLFQGWAKPFGENGEWVETRPRLLQLEVVVWRDPSIDPGA